MKPGPVGACAVSHNAPILPSPTFRLCSAAIFTNPASSTCDGFMATKKKRRLAPQARRLEKLRAANKELRTEVAELNQIRERQSNLLCGVAAALYGPPPSDVLWDHSQLPRVTDTLMTTLKVLAAEPSDHASPSLRTLLRSTLVGVWAKGREGLPVESQPYPFLVLGKRDHCEVCHGRRGGVPGNENILDGVTVCDYCSATLMAFDAAKQTKVQELRA